MYNSQETSTRIKKTAKEKGIPMLELQELCGLNKNAIAQAGKSQEGMKAKNLYAIAELLDCSVDYLLGRTDDPNGHSTVSIGGDNNNNGTQAINGNVSVTAHEKQPDSLTEQFLQQFDSLSFEDKLAIMQYVQDIKKSSPEGDGEEE